MRDTLEVLFSPGEQLAEVYEIQSLIGHGAMAQVFDAYDRSLRRTVAVKASRRHLQGEAQALAAVRHASVPTVHACGVHRGINYLVMERIVGTTLDAHMAQRTAGK